MTELIAAVQNPYNAGEVRALIDAGTDVNKTYEDGTTALFYAVKQSNNENVVRALIDAGADVNKTYEDGTTALFYAVKQSNNENVVRALIDAGADVNKTYEDGTTALFYAVRQSNNENVVRALIDAGADVNETDDDGLTALFYAVQQRNNEDVVRALIETGSASLNIRDSYGRTPLFYAWKCPTTFEYLLGKGKHKYSHLKDNCNVSIVTFVIENVVVEHAVKVDDVSKQYLDPLIKHGVKKKTIVKALVNVMFSKMPLVTVSDQTEAILSIVIHLASLCEKLLDLGSSTHKKLKEIVMMLESDRKNQDILKVLQLLVELGADPNSADSDGNTALHYVTRLPLFGIPQDIVMEMCLRLEEYGVPVGIKNHEGQTPLLFCLFGAAVMRISRITLSAFKILVRVCTFLLKCRTILEETSRSEESVYHLMMKLFQKALEIPDDPELRGDVLYESMELLQIFTDGKVSKGNIVNKPDGNLNSPVHLWASLALTSPQCYTSNITTGHTFETLLKEILENLLKLRAKLNPRNENEETPLHLCRTWSALKLLLDARVNPKDVDSSGRSALLVAANNKTLVEITNRLYPDVTEDPRSFWKSTIDKGFDLLAVDQHGNSVLSLLVQSGNYPLSKALVDVVCEENNTQSETTFVSLLNCICKDTSTRNNWKSVLVQNLLKSRTTPTTASTPLHFCCRNLIAEFGERDAQGFESFDHDEPGSEDQLKTSKVQNSVHYEIAHLLIRYGADPRSVDSSGKSCVDIAETCPALKDLLTKTIDINTIEVAIPWNSVSKKYESSLAKVARRQETEVVDSFWYHKDNIGSGSFGHVFAGINEKDGREVAIKRVETLRMTRPEDKREITNLTKLADCEQVVRYLHFLEKGDFSFVVLELMEGNLDDYFQESFNASQAVQLCEDVVLGVKFLHEQSIIHRDLKPTNYLYKRYPKLCLKIADFGLSQCIDILGKTTECGTNVGTRCWIAPEALKSGNHDKSSDVFSCGLLLHYILSKQKHPFSPVDCADKEENQVALETGTNVLNGRMEGWDSSLSPEATDLVKKMLANETNIIDRPTAKEALQHPLFWSQEKKIDVLYAVGNQPEFECPRAKRTYPLAAVETDLEMRFDAIVIHGTWNDRKYVNMPAIYKEMTPPRRRPYDTTSVVELVRFIRNTYSHVSSNRRPGSFRKMLLEDFVFLEYFPQLVLEVYKVVTTHGWDQTKTELNTSLRYKTADLLKPIDINTIASVIPWTSVSKKYEGRLAKVAKRQEMEVVDSFWYHKDNIGSGSFGHVFAGINEKDGREVAIKRVETLRMNRREDKREITNLTKLADCEQVVRYIHFLEKGHFSFVVLELMEGNLDDYFQEFFNASQAVKLCEDVVLGVKFLHEQNIIHRDLKPTNILYKRHPKLRLKIADFGLSKCIDILGKTTVYGTNVGTRCWIAPESLKSGKHTKSSDVFSSGLLLHYILSAQKHPFSPVDCADKAEFQVALETESNVINDKIEGWDNSFSPEVTDLVKKMLANEENIIDRPTANAALQHPLFWSKVRKIDVLKAVGNQPEFECPRARRTHPLTGVETDLETRFGAIVIHGTWNDPRYVNMPAIYAEMTPQRRRSYDTSSVVELVRFIRNTYSHVSEDRRPGPIRKMLLEDFVFLEYFPQLVLEVYEVVTAYGWDLKREEVKYAINK